MINSLHVSSKFRSKHDRLHYWLRQNFESLQQKLLDEAIFRNRLYYNVLGNSQNHPIENVDLLTILELFKIYCKIKIISF